MNQTNLKQSETEIFSEKEIILISLVFIGFWIGINIFFRFIASFFNRGLSTYWPVGKVEPMIPSILGIIIAISIFFGFLIILKLNSKYDFNLYYIILIGIVLIMGTNIIHGLWKGFVTPNEGSGGLTFHWEALEIVNPYDFIRTHNDRQENMHLHARTHPPGAVLLYYLLYKIFFFSGLISAAILIISAVFSSYFLYKILKREINEGISLYITFLFLLIPAIQVYYLANIYAIVTTLILGVIYFYMHPNNKIGLSVTIVFLFLIASLTFMLVFVLGLLFCFESLKSFKTKSIKNFFNLYIISLCLFIFFVVFLVLFDFNYIVSFLYASKEENPQGFRLFADPYDYFITRIEDILEILFFFGPFLFILLKRGIPIMKKESPDFHLLMVSAIIILLTLFLAGVYQTGETARACSYIYPFLLFPIAFYFNDNNFSLKEKNKLLILVFVQAIMMQAMGYYKW